MMIVITLLKLHDILQWFIVLIWVTRCSLFAGQAGHSTNWKKWENNSKVRDSPETNFQLYRQLVDANFSTATANCFHHWNFLRALVEQLSKTQENWKQK